MEKVNCKVKLDGEESRSKEMSKKSPTPFQLYISMSVESAITTVISLLVVQPRIVLSEQQLVYVCVCVCVMPNLLCMK